MHKQLSILSPVNNEKQTFKQSKLVNFLHHTEKMLQFFLNASGNNIRGTTKEKVITCSVQLTLSN